MATIYDDGGEYDALGMGYGTGQELRFLQSLAPQGESVLELACGTGRLAVPLAQAGADVVGIDTAPSMLAAARVKAAEAGVTVRFAEADVRRFSFNQLFGLVFCANNSLAHLHTLSDIEACFACVRRHLLPEGRFVVEMFTPSLELLSRTPGRHYPVTEFQAPGGEWVTVTETVDYDAATQISHAVWHYASEDGTVSARPLDLRMFFPQELDALLALSGFTIEAKYGDFDRAPFSRASQR